jgi:hypothetical protein
MFEAVSYRVAWLISSGPRPLDRPTARQLDSLDSSTARHSRQFDSLTRKRISADLPLEIDRSTG